MGATPRASSLSAPSDRSQKRGGSADGRETLAIAYGRIDYDNHARENMVKRRISARQVLTTLNRPDRVVPTRSDRLIVERRTEAGNTIRVVYVE